MSIVTQGIIGKMAGYSGKTLKEKLGLKEGLSSVALHAPSSYLRETGITQQSISSDHDFVHFFTTDRLELAKEFPKLKKAIKPNGALWVSWPKGSSKVKTDLNENTIRDIGLENKTVDIKVIAIDEIWSGLKFVIRVKDRE